MALSAEEEKRAQQERSAAGRLKKAERDVVHTLMSTPEGRRWMEQALEFCQLYNNEHVNIDSTLVTLGRKQVGAYLLDQLEQHAPNAYMQMLRERRVRVAAENEERAAEERQREAMERGPDYVGVTDLEERMDEQGKKYEEEANRR